MLLSASALNDKFRQLFDVFIFALRPQGVASFFKFGKHPFKMSPFFLYKGANASTNFSRSGC